MKKSIFALLFCFTPLVVAAAPLKVVNVSAPAINCGFNDHRAETDRHHEPGGAAHLVKARAPM